MSKTIVESAGAFVAEAAKGFRSGTSNARVIKREQTNRRCLKVVRLLAEVCVLMIPLFINADMSSNSSLTREFNNPQTQLKPLQL